MSRIFSKSNVLKTLICKVKNDSYTNYLLFCKLCHHFSGVCNRLKQDNIICFYCLSCCHTFSVLHSSIHQRMIESMSFFLFADDVTWEPSVTKKQYDHASDKLIVQLKPSSVFIKTQQCFLGPLTSLQSNHHSINYILASS